jgi:hypothetical protein
MARNTRREIIGRQVKGGMLLNGVSKRHRESFLALIEEMQYAGCSDEHIVDTLKVQRKLIGV